MFMAIEKSIMIFASKEEGFISSIGVNIKLLTVSVVGGVKKEPIGSKGVFFP
jgi:hypothetical protein